MKKILPLLFLFTLSFSAFALEDGNTFYKYPLCVEGGEFDSVEKGRGRLWLRFSKEDNDADVFGSIVFNNEVCPIQIIRFGDYENLKDLREIAQLEIFEAIRAIGKEALTTFAVRSRIADVLRLHEPLFHHSRIWPVANHLALEYANKTNLALFNTATYHRIKSEMSNFTHIAGWATTDNYYINAQCPTSGNQVWKLKPKRATKTTRHWLQVDSKSKFHFPEYKLWKVNGEGEQKDSVFRFCPTETRN